MFSFRIEALQDDRVRYANQPIALVVAETLEAATEGARLLAPTYEVEPARIGFDAGVRYQPETVGIGAPASFTVGDLAAGMAAAARVGPRPRSRRRCSITTPWSRTRSSRHGTATG